jgi:hypothetical protein
VFPTAAPTTTVAFTTTTEPATTTSTTQAPRPTTTTAPETTTTIPTEEETFELLDPGAEPRRELRYEFEEGVFRNEATMTVDFNISVDDEPFPIGEIEPITVLMETSIDSVDAEGTAEYTTEVVEIDGGETSEEELEEILGPLDSLEGSGTIDDRGNNVSDQAPVDLGDPAMSLQFNEFFNQLGGPQLPEEAVGAGARWARTQTVGLFGLFLTVTAESELTEVDEDEFTITTDLMIHGIQGDIDAFPGIPEGGGVEFESLESAGWGESAGEFSSPVVASRIANTMLMVMRVTDPDIGEALLVMTITMDALSEPIDID